eukprot:m.206175 g.206175  ORF g.206175 m.206175 type:complete len:1229 (+) comp17100_c0_seq1:60-3746(+)
MGVPAFYRWLSRKYPKCVKDCTEETPQIVGDQYVPVNTAEPNPNGEEFDNLYLDMNGIIHPASHPEDRPPPKTEDDMYLAIIEYLERVFAAVRPRKVLYMAIDGVAPRAKMNQQRSRRFRSAQERELKEEAKQKLLKEWEEQGRELPPPSGPEFDSNVITPGTPFMERLADYLRIYVHAKIDHDPGWRDIKVVFSDATVPGEGEHKIMEFIRLQRTLPEYKPNTKHVIHGLDADLIMLALATHEPHFTILREEVFAKKTPQQPDLEAQVKDALETAAKQAATADGEVQPESRTPAVYAKPFQFLRINILREYLAKEMDQGANYSCVGGFNLERVLDDFVFMCFFVGNDFLPHLPSLEIREGAIDTIMDLYQKDFHVFGGYLTQNGEVDLARVEMLLKGLAEVEDEILSKRREGDERYKKKKQDIKDKKTTQEHLKLIRECTSEHSHDIVMAGHTNSQRGAGSDRGSRIVPDVTGAHAGMEVTAEHFRIKNRTTGGRRALRSGVNSRTAENLALLDRIREFADDESPQRARQMPLKGLNGYLRSLAHGYCDELGLKHESQGTDPNRFIMVARDDSDEDTDVEVSAGDAFNATLKEQMREDAIVPEHEDKIKLGSQGWRDRYYENKFGPEVDRRGIIQSYVEGLVWVMRYYYQGCCSWNWYFPFHYAPFAADFVNVKDLVISFEKGRPFLPYEQLMAVFPAGSSHALPESYQKLMVDPESPIISFYPTEFALDLNGKKFTWQAVVLLPFIDEAKLLEALAPLEATLSEDERRRNTVGNHRIFVHQRHPAAPQLVGLADEDLDIQLLDANLIQSAPAPATATDAKEPEAKMAQDADEPDLLALDLNELAAEQLQAELTGDGDEEARLKALIAKARDAQAQAEAKPKDGAHVQGELGHRAAYLRVPMHHRKAVQRHLEELPAGTEILDANSTGGIGGFVSIAQDAPALGVTVQPPDFHGLETESQFLLKEFVNRAAQAKFFVPLYAPHRTQILPGCQVPALELTGMDFPQTPRFTAVRRNTLNKSAAGRMIRHNMDRRQGHGHGHHQQHHQPRMTFHDQTRVQQGLPMVSGRHSHQHHPSRSHPADRSQPHSQPRHDPRSHHGSGQSQGHYGQGHRQDGPKREHGGYGNPQPSYGHGYGAPPPQRPRYETPSYQSQASGRQGPPSIPPTRRGPPMIPPAQGQSGSVPPYAAGRSQHGQGLAPTGRQQGRQQHGRQDPRNHQPRGKQLVSTVV